MMRILRFVALASILVCWPASAAAEESDDPLIAGYPGLVEWFRSHGGMSKTLILDIIILLVLLPTNPYQNLALSCHHHAYYIL